MSIAIITGTSSGLGAEFAKQLDYRELSEIWIVARRVDRLKALQSQLKTPTRVIVADLTSQSDLDSFGDLVRREQPIISYMINNAGLGRVGRFRQISSSENMEMIDLNIKALTFLTHLAIPYMQKGSQLILVSSVASFVPLSGFSVYAATKAYVTSLGSALHEELKELGIQVCTVCPGPVKTEFASVSRMEMRTTGGEVLPAEVVARALRDSSKKRTHSIYGCTNKILPLAIKIAGIKIGTKLSWWYLRNRIESARPRE